MNRTDLVAALKRAAPCLSSRDIVEAHACFFFGGGNVQAYDDIVAIEAPCDIGDFEGGVRGKVLLDYLSASRARGVEFIEKSEELEVKAGRGRLKLAVLPREDLTIDWPEKDIPAITVTEELLQGLRAAFISVGLDPSAEERYGITIWVEDGTVYLYSTDDLSVTEAIVPDVEGADDFEGLITILPPRWCELVLAGEPPTEIHLSESWVEATYEDGTRIFTRTLPDAKPEVLLRILDNTDWSEFEPIPKGMDACLQKSLVVLGAAEDQSSDVYVKAGKLRFTTVGTYGTARDFVPFDHDDVIVRARPSLLRRALPFASGLSIGEAIAFEGDGFRHLVSVIEESD